MFGLLGLLLASSGCSFISSSGPTRADIENAAGVRTQDVGPDSKLAYALVTLNARIAGQMHVPDEDPTFGEDFTSRPPARVNIGIGDVLTITIFESAAGGLFIPAEGGARGGNFVQVPPQQVDGSGNITMPFGGTLHVAGLSPIETQKAFEARIDKRALEPQVVVSLTEHHSNEVTVIGDAALGGASATMRFSLDPGGTRIMDAVARAGGPKYPAFQTLVTVQRDGREESAMLSAIAANPTQNIQLQSGDAVYIGYKPKYFVAFGATGQSTTLAQLNRRFAFTDPSLTLADALALAGGLEDDRANPAGLFLYRLEVSGYFAELWHPGCCGATSNGPDNLCRQPPRPSGVLPHQSGPCAQRGFALRFKCTGSGSAEILDTDRVGHWVGVKYWKYRALLKPRDVRLDDFCNNRDVIAYIAWQHAVF